MGFQTSYYFLVHRLRHRCHVWWSKIRLIFVRFFISGWTGELSIKSTTFLSWARKEESNFLIHSQKRFPVIQLFFWLLYWQGNCLTFLKHRGVLDLTTTNMSNSSPVALAAAMPVSWALLFFPREHFSPLIFHSEHFSRGGLSFLVCRHYASFFINNPFLTLASKIKFF